MRLLSFLMLTLLSASTFADTISFRYSASLTDTGGVYYSDSVAFYFTLDGDDVAVSNYMDLADISVDSISASMLKDGELIDLTVTAAGGELVSRTEGVYFGQIYPVPFFLRMTETQTNPGVETEWAFGLYDDYYIGCRTCYIETYLVGGGETYRREVTVGFDVVPVPAAVWLLGSALLGLFGFRRLR